MISINDFNVNVIPQLLLYFVPGYIAIAVYRILTGRDIKDASSIWVPCVISYVFVSAAKALLPDSASSRLELLALIVCSTSALVSAVMAKLFQNRHVRKVFRAVLHYNPASTVLSSRIDMQSPGSTARIYLKDATFYVEGAIASYSNNAADPYIALWRYRFYELNAEEPYYECTNEAKHFIVNLDNVQHIEVWPTIPAADSNN